MNGRRKQDSERIDKAKAESAKPARVWRMMVMLYVYADDARDAKEKAHQIVEHWLVDRAMIPALDQIVEVDATKSSERP